MDLETLWYGVLGLAVLFYAILDGFDLGVGSLHLFARNDLQRRTFLNAIGPVWDGNEVWIVIVMGGLFAGFPNAYATLFSGFYTLLMFLIAGLIFRAAAIEFRSKREGALWRSFWDVFFCLSSVLVAFILGVILGNLVEGVDLDAQQDYIGDFTDFLRPYPVLLGLTSIALFTMHGAIYLLMKTEGETYAVVHRWTTKAILSFLFWYLVISVATLLYKPHMLLRIREYPIFLILPLFSLFAIGNIPLQVRRGCDGWAFLSSCAAIASLLVLYVLGTYPILIPSLIDPEANSLTIYNSASSPETLTVLLIVVAIGVPLVLSYGFWVYRIFRGKVRLTDSSY